MRFLRVLFILPALASFFSGCVSSKYKLAKSSTPPAIAINLASVQPPVETMLNTVIVIRGPGSWKREAHWDEYVLTVANRGVTPLTFESISLAGLAGSAVLADADPWALEKRSRTLEEQGFGIAKGAAVQVGGGIAVVTASAAAGAGTFGLIYGSAWGATAAGALIVGTVAIPAFIGGSIYANISSRHEVEREFQRRRLALPVALVGGQIAQGSVFFPITPGPRRLTLRYRDGNESREAVVDLTPLVGLHLKSPPAVGAGVAPSATPATAGP